MRLPVMQCDDGCGQCCGIVPVSTRELETIRTYVREHGITPVAQGEGCPLYLEGRCSVYPVRPVICQAFGHHGAMKCPRGYNTKTVKPKALEQWITREPRPHFLHELLRE